MFEYMISAGPGTLIDYGTCINFSLVDLPQFPFVELYLIDDQDQSHYVEVRSPVEFLIRPIPPSELYETGR